MAFLYFLWLSFSVFIVDCSDWHLVWQDEFNGEELDLNHWQYQIGGINFGSHEIEYYTNRTKNVRIENGSLVIDVQIEKYDSYNFTSGRIHGKQSWTYGKFEARARLPSGHQLWPAIWMMPHLSKYGSWAASGEIDIMENKGDHPAVIEATIHYGGKRPYNTHTGSGPRDFHCDLSKDFHLYAIEWNAKEIRFYLDNNHYFTADIDRMMWSGKGPNPYTRKGQPFDQSFHWILNVAIGGSYFGPGPYVTPEQAKHWPKSTMEIDYLRVYQQKK